MGQGLLVLEAARALKAGQPVEEIARSLEMLREHLRLLFVVDTLEFLRRGGRIGGAQAFLGSMLRLKPLLALREGAIEAVERVRTKQRAVRRMLDILADEAAGQPMRVSVVHAAAPEEGAALRQQVQARLDCRELYLAELSPGVGTHTGPGTVGVVICPVAED
jgi:DegV family protein with EDD domain